MKSFFIKSIVVLLFAFAFLPKSSIAQADTLLKVCSQHLLEPFISDGQQYKAILNGEETAEFRCTFYGGSTYRIIVCSGFTDGNITFSLLDSNKNLLFTNTNYELSPYWDFKFNSTIECIIEAQLVDASKSAFAIMLIGFKPY